MNENYFCLNEQRFDSLRDAAWTISRGYFLISPQMPEKFRCQEFINLLSFRTENDPEIFISAP